MDPPFRLAPGDSSFNLVGTHRLDRRPSLLDNPGDIKAPESTREALVQHLNDRFKDNPDMLAVAVKDCHFVLGDLYRIVASNWVDVIEYVNREMATIEYILEKEEPGFRDLEVYLKDLYIYRRRCTKYHELITQARQQCSTRGQQNWPHDSQSALAGQDAGDMEGDFVFLQAKTQATAGRIEKNINLLTALVAIGEGKQALDENHGVARLNLLAMFFLPFSTVATILSMQGNYAPGAGAFWVFWAVAIPFTAFIVGISALYDGVGLTVYRHFRQLITEFGKRGRVKVTT